MRVSFATQQILLNLCLQTIKTYPWGQSAARFSRKERRHAKDPRAIAHLFALLIPNDQPEFQDSFCVQKIIAYLDIHDGIFMA